HARRPPRRAVARFPRHAAWAGGHRREVQEGVRRLARGVQVGGGFRPGRERGGAIAPPLPPPRGPERRENAGGCSTGRRRGRGIRRGSPAPPERTAWGGGRRGPQGRAGAAPPAPAALHPEASATAPGRVPSAGTIPPAPPALGPSLPPTRLGAPTTDPPRA